VRAAFGTAAAIALAAYAAFFVAWNGDHVRIHLLFARFDGVPLWSVVLGAFALGAALVGTVTGFSLLRLRLRLRGQRREVGRLEQEVHGLRTLPLAPDDTGSRAREG
jgi:uncharacterized integral membrane protein